jgi:hypothetical protein
VYQRGPGNFWIKWREGSQTRYAHGYETRELAADVLGTIVANLTRGHVGLKVDSKSAPTLDTLARVAVDLSAATGKILPLPVVVSQAVGEAGSGAVGYAGVTHDEGADTGGTVTALDHSEAGVAKWYTQRTQNPPPSRA